MVRKMGAKPVEGFIKKADKDRKSFNENRIIGSREIKQYEKV